MRDVCNNTGFDAETVGNGLKELKLGHWVVGGKTKLAIATVPSELDRLLSLHSSISTAASDDQSQGRKRKRDTGHGRVRAASEHFSASDYVGLET